MMVLIDATPLQSEHRVRGVGTYVRHLAEGLLAHGGEDFRFFLASRPALDWPALNASASTAWRIHRPAQLYWLHNELVLRYGLHQSRATVFHATDFNGLVLAPPVRTVATLHDLTPLQGPDSGRATISAHLANWRWAVYFRKLSRADHIITVSASVKNDAMARLHIPAERITVIHPGVNTERFGKKPLMENFSPLKPYALFLGVPDANKNLERIIEAFGQIAARIPNLKLVTAGSWTAAHEQWFTKRLRDLGLRERAKHLGYVGAAELPSLYGHASAFLFPSLAEGFGSPLVEAMASGVPVITTEYGALAEVAGNAALLVNPRDTDAIARALCMVITEAPLRRELVARGHRRARAFSWETVTQKTIAVYERLEREPSSPPVQLGRVTGESDYHAPLSDLSRTR